MRAALILVILGGCVSGPVYTGPVRNPYEFHAPQKLVTLQLKRSVDNCTEEELHRDEKP